MRLYFLSGVFSLLLHSLCAKAAVCEGTLSLKHRVKNHHPVFLFFFFLLSGSLQLHTGTIRPIHPFDLRLLLLPSSPNTVRITVTRFTVALASCCICTSVWYIPKMTSYSHIMFTVCAVCVLFISLYDVFWVWKSWFQSQNGHLEFYFNVLISCICWGESLPKCLIVLLQWFIHVLIFITESGAACVLIN